MEELLSRWQFGITTVYHFLFVPLTLGLSIMVALMEVMYVRTDNEIYKKMTKFWGKLFLINFSMGVVTGIVQEFHFGMNWSEYSRFMGDIFGAPLALEALTAFFLESVFIGLWIFGWDKLSKKMHALCMCLVAFGSNLSAFWILVANSFMQNPVGYAIRNGRAEMTDFSALITNEYVLHQYPHVIFAGLVTAGIFVASISAWHLLRNSQTEFFAKSFKLGITVALIFSMLVGVSGHSQAKFLAKAQPMKLASIEALWETENPAPFAVIAAIEEKAQKNTFELTVPYGLTMLVYDSLNGEVKGIKDLQQAYELKYGPGNYIPEVTPLFWSFRIMVVSGMWLIGLCLIGFYLSRKNKLEQNPLILKLTLFSLPVPYIANSFGWFVTEGGRQPWIVVGLQKVAQGVSPNVGELSIWISLIGFTLVYAVLAGAAIYLARKVIIQGPKQEVSTTATVEKGATLWS